MLGVHNLGVAFPLSINWTSLTDFKTTFITYQITNASGIFININEWKVKITNFLRIIRYQNSLISGYNSPRDDTLLYLGAGRHKVAYEKWWHMKGLVGWIGSCLFFPDDYIRYKTNNQSIWDMQQLTCLLKARWRRLPMSILGTPGACSFTSFSQRSIPSKLHLLVMS